MKIVTVVDEPISITNRLLKHIISESNVIVTIRWNLKRKGLLYHIVFQTKFL